MPPKQLKDMTCVVCGEPAIMAWNLSRDYAACGNVSCIKAVNDMWMMIDFKHPDCMESALAIRKVELQKGQNEN
jgi:hypothetical protein